MKSSLGYLLLIGTLLTLTGCTSAPELARKLAEYEKLGIKEVHITGKFSNTDYVVETKDGKRTATIDHSDAWMPKVKIVRETPEK